MYAMWVERGFPAGANAADRWNPAITIRLICPERDR
jgi:hypothetical protein